MIVGYLTSEYPSVSHTFIRREGAALRRRGVELKTFSIRRPKGDDWMGSEDLAEKRATFYVLPAPVLALAKAHVQALFRHPGRYLTTLVRAVRHRPPGLRAGVYSLIYFAEAILLAAELHRQGITHLHNHFANPAAIVGLLASRYLGLTWSLTLHGISEFDYPAGLLLKDKIEAARFVACVSHFVRAQAQRLVDPRHWPKLLINRCGLDPRVLPAGKPRAPDHRLRVLAVGRLSPEKAFPGLIEAFAKVRKSGMDSQLDIIGDGPEREHLLAAIQAHQLEADCRLLGRQSEAAVLEHMRATDVLAMSSLMEGLPVVLMEALAMEVPVVAPCVAGIPELVQNSRTGLLYNPGNWPELGDCLLRLLGDAELRRRLGSQGRQRFLEEFDIERAIEPILGALRAAHAPTTQSALPPR